MAKSDRKDRVRRVVITVTEVTPVRLLWREALHFLEESHAELLALFLAGDQWHRAARLPFTREISRISGNDADFTTQRASEVHEEAIKRSQDELRRLASEADREVEIEVVPESEQTKVKDLLEGSQNIVIVPSSLASQPLIDELKKLDCRIMLIND